MTFIDTNVLVYFIDKKSGEMAHCPRNNLVSNRQSEFLHFRAGAQ